MSSVSDRNKYALEHCTLSFLNLLFYMTLALMLATLFNSRAPGLGISLLIAWMGPLQILARPMEKYVPWLENILPWKLISGFGEMKGFESMLRGWLDGFYGF